MLKSSHFTIGLASLALSAFLFLFAIPTWVTTPGNVSNVVLSPVFWPYALSGVLALVGAGLLIMGSREIVAAPDDAADAPAHGTEAWMRLGAMAVLMAVYAAAIPRLGMVWASMLAFAAAAFLMRTRHPLPALVSAVAVPLILYAFFAHVASVAVPQGDFVRLP
ncbi:tripartite tricarboxylate transporter TctB family protein [Rhodovulum sp. YNF3179]|uniref:tripartite tricarboxylate transporter TctB family protein n=1 Tax=Rhodovulum sp. YNF3179 TaxID=3425127 RepID=UPI003D32C6F1